MRTHQLFNRSLYELHLIIDVRDEYMYKKGFISSSLNVPETDEKTIENKIQAFLLDYGFDYPKNAVVVSNKGNFYNVEPLCRVLVRMNITPEILQGGYETFEAQYPFLCTECEHDEAMESAIERSIIELEPYPSLVLQHQRSRMYVGNITNARNRNVIRNLGITHIINMTRHEYAHDENIDYVQISIDDDEWVNITQIITMTNVWLKQAMKSGGRILVHCAKGKSRSVSIVLAFMIEHYRMSYDSALNEVRKARPMAGPNRGFERQLRVFTDSQHIYDPILSPRLCSRSPSLDMGLEREFSSPVFSPMASPIFSPMFSPMAEHMFSR